MKTPSWKQGRRFSFHDRKNDDEYAAERYHNLSIHVFSLHNKTGNAKGMATMNEQQPISKVSHLGKGTFVPAGKYRSLAIQRIGDQLAIVFADEAFLCLAFCPVREIIGQDHLYEVTSIHISDDPNNWTSGERILALDKGTIGHILELNAEEDPDTYISLYTKRPLPVICAFMKDEEPMLVLKSTTGNYLLKSFSLTRLNQSGWDSAISNDGTKQYMFQIAQHGKIECIHQPE